MTAKGGRIGGRWLAEHETKALLRAAGVPVVPGRLAAGEDDAVAALDELGGPVALKRSAAGLLHKARNGGLALDLAGEPELRAAWRALPTATGSSSSGWPSPAPSCSSPSAATRSCPRSSIGLGGVHAEVLDDVAVIPLPARPKRIAAALRGLRGAPLLAGLDIAGRRRRGSPPSPRLDGLELIECNPVLVHERGAVVVDAVAKEIAA